MLKRILTFLPAVCALLSASAAAASPEPAGPEPAGHVVLLIGDITLQRNGETRAPKRGDPVYEGDEFVTGRGGHLHLRTIDGGRLAVRPGSRVALKTYRFGAQETPAIRIELHHGVLRSVTGDRLDEHKDRFRLNTPIAAIGIRGTDFSVYADANATRASVAAGEIVLSPFDAGCLRETLGACGGNNAFSLAGNRRQDMLTLERGQTRPRLAPIDQTAPDRISPPLEEVGRAPLSKDEQIKVADRVQQVLDAVSVAKPTDPTGPGTPPPPPPAVEPLRVDWGRWARLNGEAAQVDLQALAADGSLVFTNKTHALIRAPIDKPVMPEAGIVNFSLGKAEAWLHDGAQSVRAAVTGGQLTVDFARSHFNMDLGVAADASQWNLRAAGDVTRTGLLVSDWRTPGSNATVRGALAGAGAGQAATLFTRDLGASREITGAARWSK